MFCENCGEKLDQGAKFCSKCGSQANHILESKNNKTSSKDQNDKIKKSKARSYLYVATFLVAFVIAVPIGKWAMQSFLSLFSSKSSQSKNVEESLIQVSAEINKTLPKKVDSATQLTSTTVSGKDLIYAYEILTNNPITQNDLDSSLKSSLIKGVCSNADTKNLLDMGVGLIYSYSDNNGKYIGKIPVYLSNCE